MTQPKLFDSAVPVYGQMGDAGFERGSDTSAAAAVSIRDHLPNLEQRVYDLLKAQPRTSDAIEAATGLSHQTVSARIRGLVLRGLVEDSGLRAATRSGRMAAIKRVRSPGGA